MIKSAKKRIRLTVTDRVDFMLRAQAKLCSVQSGRPVSVGEVIDGLIGQMKLMNWKAMREKLKKVGVEMLQLSELDRQVSHSFE